MESLNGSLFRTSLAVVLEQLRKLIKKLSYKAFFLAMWTPVKSYGPVLTKILRTSTSLYSRSLSRIFFQVWKPSASWFMKITMEA